MNGAQTLTLALKFFWKTCIEVREGNNLQKSRQNLKERIIIDMRINEIKIKYAVT